VATDERKGTLSGGPGLSGRRRGTGLSAAEGNHSSSGLDSGSRGRDLSPGPGGKRPHSDRRKLMSEVDGATIVARNLKRQGVKFMFGIVGFPVGPIAAA